MRKILCTVIICILALVFVSVSNVSAFGKGKILYAEYLITAKIKYLDEVTGDYLWGAGGGDGIVYIDKTWVFGEYAFLVESFDAVPGSYARFFLSDYTWNSTKNLLKSIDIDLQIYDPDDILIYEYYGPCVAKFTFSSAKAFTGTITFIDAGEKRVYIIKGKKLGQYPTAQL